jgi:hypothetical protein
MAGQLSKYEREVRDTVVKSSLTGVAATVIAVTAISPAGFGDWIGASVASNIGFDASANAADNPYVNLPPFAPPLTQAELDTIRGQLSSAEASLTLLRAATDAKIERARALALTEGAVTFAPMPVAVRAPQLRLSLSQPASLDATASFAEAPVESYVAAAPPEVAAATPASFSSGGGSGSDDYRDPHLELADLFFAHETF